MNFFRINPKITALLVLLVAQFSGLTYSLRAEDAASRQAKAVVETSQELGFKLLPKAIQNIGVITKAAEVSASTLTLPKSALVHSLDQLAIYRLRDNWFKLIAVTLVTAKGDLVTVRTAELQNGDQIAIQGVALLRVSDMEAFGGEE